MTIENKIEQVPIDEVKYNGEVYPRDGIDRDVVNQYKLNLEKLPPIIISQEDNTLIDGYHRWLAYRDEGKTKIPVKYIKIDKSQYLIKAIQLNAKHGKGLSIAEKKNLAVRLRKDDYDVEKIAKLLSVNVRFASEWTQKVQKQKNEERDQKIMELYLACRTEKEIAKKIGISQQNVAKIISNTKNFICKEISKPPDSYRYFNLWDFTICDSRYGRKYPGRMPGQVVENLLYYYTDFFDIVLDPMAGSGTTIDVCKEMNRRYLAYDIQPDPEKLIVKHNILDGVPHKRRYKPKLIILDPPYSRQKKGKYSKDPSNLANLPLDEFYPAMNEIIKNCKRILSDNGYLALIIGSSQLEGRMVDHAHILYGFMEKYLTFEHRIIVPYTEQQVTGAHVVAAKKGKFMLKKYRDLMIFKKETKKKCGK